MQIANKVSVGSFDFDEKEEILLAQKLSKNEVSKLVDSFKAIVMAIETMANDVNLLTHAAVQGQLTTRADAENHQGKFRDIVSGINSTLDTAIAPIREAIGVMGEIAKGNLHAHVMGNYQGDHAAIKDMLNQMTATLSGYITEISQVLGEVSSGNLSMEITSEYLGEFNELKLSINNIVDALNSTMTEIGHASIQVAAGTRQVSEGSQTISQGATEQASSIEELSSTVASIALRPNRMPETRAPQADLPTPPKPTPWKAIRRCTNFSKPWWRSTNQAKASPRSSRSLTTSRFRRISWP